MGSLFLNSGFSRKKNKTKNSSFLCRKKLMILFSLAVIFLIFVPVVSAGCTSNSDCSSGYSCEDKQWVKEYHWGFDTSQCSWKTVYLCSHYHWYYEGTCKKKQICTPNSVSCNGNYIKKCNSAGTSWYNYYQYCSNGCSNGQCKVCTPNSVSCNGNYIKKCNSAGTSWYNYYQYCSNGCSNGQCKVCTPNSVSCNGNYIKKCNSAGTSWYNYYQYCSNGCSNGQCKVCTPGTKQCDGSNLKTCNSDGSGWTTTSCTYGCANNACNSNPSICTNGQTQACTVSGCAGTKTCSNNQWGSCIKNDPCCGITCSSGQTCQSGQCVSSSGGTCPSITNGGFESGTSGWTFGGQGDHKIGTTVYSGSKSALIGFKDSSNVANGKDYVYQTITVPSGSSAVLSFYYRFYSYDYCNYDFFNMKIRDGSGNVKSTVISKCHGGGGLKDTGWTKKEVDLSSYAGKTIQIYFEIENRYDTSYKSWAFVDDVEIKCESEFQFCGGLDQTCCASNKCGAGLTCKNSKCIRVPEPILDYKIGEKIRNPECSGLFCGFGKKDYLPFNINLINIGKTTRSGTGALVQLKTYYFRDNYFYLSSSNNYGRGDFDSVGWFDSSSWGGSGYNIKSKFELHKSKMDEDELASSGQLYYRIKSSSTYFYIYSYIYDTDGKSYGAPTKSIYVQGIGFWEGIFEQLEPVGDAFKFIIFDYNCPDFESCAFETVTILPWTKAGKLTKVTRVVDKGSSSVKYVYEFAASSGTITRITSKSSKLDVSLLLKLEDKGVNLQRLSDNVGYISKITQKTNGDIIVAAERYGKNVESYFPNSGKAFINDLNINKAGKTDAIYKGELGEATVKSMENQKGWIVQSGFKKGDVTDTGIDKIYKNSNGEFVIVEAKFISKAGNVGIGDLGKTITKRRQMSDDWIKNSLKEMRELNKNNPDKGIDKKLYNDIINDIRSNKKINKELVVVRNSADEGNTITKSLTDGTNGVHLDGVTIINLGGTVV